MAQEYDIFKNLEDLKKINLLDKLKSLVTVSSEQLNDSQDLDDSFDFDALVDNNGIKKNLTKRQLQAKGKNATPEKRTTKGNKSRRKSSSSNGSTSPAMSMSSNLSTAIKKMPVGRVTRSSKNYEGQEKTNLVLENNVSLSKNRGRGKRNGRGRGRGQTTLNASENSLQDLQNNTDLSSISQNIASRSSSNAMRARRQYFAERAARCTQVDYIDLVSSPMLRVEGFIDLDSDTEQEGRTTRSKKRNQKNRSTNTTKDTKTSIHNSLDISYDEDNPELNIKINWKGQLETFKLRKYQKFSTIFKQIAEREDVGMESMVFNLNRRIIMADDTPDSINYKIYDFIDGRVLLNPFNSPLSLAPKKKRDANNITLKIQSDKWKRPLEINIMKTDKFRILYIKCAEELKVDIDRLKLSFDGEMLDVNDTPGDLDLETGEAIDLRIK